MTLHSNRPEEMLPASSRSAGAAVASAGVRRAGDWLCLAATPTFAIMALLTDVFGGPDICSVAPGAFPLSGMVPMYLLMSIFHSGPWLKLISGWRAWQAEKVKNIEA
jgi:hypothetical protein